MQNILYNIFVNLYMRKIYFLILFIIISYPLFSQEIDMISEEKKLEKLLTDLRLAKNNEEKIKRNELLKTEMRRVLKYKEALSYPFLKLTTIGFVNSPDNQIRIINWNVEKDDLDQIYTAFVIHTDKRRKNQFLTELKDNSLPLSPIPKGVISNENWYGALYYKIIPVTKGIKNYYTILGWDYYSPISQMKIIDVIYFNGKNVRLGCPIFKCGKKTKNRVLFEHSKKTSMSLKYEENPNRIIFDHLSPESPGLSKFRSFYVPDMSYDSFIFNKGKWTLHEDIVGLNKSNNSDKKFIYIMNKKTGKLERKKVKLKWLNPQDSNPPN